MKLHEVMNRGRWFRRASWRRDEPSAHRISEEDATADDWEFVDPPEAQVIPEGQRRRLEDGIALTCCGAPCKLAGNLALRGTAGSPVTRLGYECMWCHRRLQVVDAWDLPSAEQLAIYDETP